MEDQNVASECSSGRTTCESVNTDVGLQPGPWRDLRPPGELHRIRDNRQLLTYEEVDQASIRLLRPRSRSGNRLSDERLRSRRRRQRSGGRISHRGATDDDGPGDAAIAAQSLNGISPRSQLGEAVFYVSHGLWIGDRLTAWCKGRRRTGRRRNRRGVNRN